MKESALITPEEVQELEAQHKAVIDEANKEEMAELLANKEELLRLFKLSQANFGPSETPLNVPEPYSAQDVDDFYEENSELMHRLAKS